ncbi:MAG TPA: SDR family oxidoreductase [Parapedobacter sp.]|uniref:SDR family NAD(P)-dependent oxidoreductase n=1 Tax=Parapedobacter sp. TaxID=1958893 RepID=UPI002D1B5873|nr:SDR family oxidoreductase [Parapedobacter sp.]HWK56229.1 SDR family oxidoreductase [Parapedobacter sp.]
MVISFTGKTAVVTGGTSGIGKAAALQLVAAGARVAVIGRDATKLTGELAEFPDRLFFFRCELADHASIKNTFAKIGNLFGTIDVLVNNAGVQTYGNVVTTGENIWDFTMDINLKAVYLCAKYAISLMEKAPYAVIVNVGSVQGFVSQRNVAAYAASKEALHGLTRSIAIDFAPKIRCLAVCPGAVQTPMLEKDIENFVDKEAILEETRNIHLLKRIATPDEIANFITFLASDKASFATGQTYRVDGGIGVRIEGT